MTMTGRGDQTPPEPESGGGPRAGVEAVPPRDGKDVVETSHPGAESSRTPEPEPGTALDQATSTVTNTGPSS